LIKQVAGIVVAIFVLAVVGLLLFPPDSEELSPEELRRRVNDTTTDWANYQEDLKAHIGATPVARWEGRPTQSWTEGELLHISFQVSGYWSTTDVNLPVIIRDPLGKTRHHISSTRVDSAVTYTFQISDLDPGSISWVRLKFPHAERRIVYTDGTWEPPVAE